MLKTTHSTWFFTTFTELAAIIVNNEAICALHGTSDAFQTRRLLHAFTDLATFVVFLVTVATGQTTNTLLWADFFTFTQVTTMRVFLKACLTFHHAHQVSAFF